MTAATYPLVQLAPFEIDFEKFFDEVSGRVRGMRKYRRLQPLRPDGLLIGKEKLNLQVAPPSATVVPTGFRYTSARRFPDSVDPTPIYSQWMILECVCWGEDDPDKIQQLHSFSSTLEIAREIIVALTDSNYGPSSVKVDASEWMQETNQLKLGRKLFLRVEVETFVVRDPPIFMAPATDTTTGVVINVTGNLSTPDGSQIDPVATFTVPP